VTTTPPSLGPLLVGVGIVIVVAGLLVWSGALGWFGRLPGDIRIERDSVRVYIPLISMLLVSIGLSLIIGIVRRFL
jgi:hypothetical protein